MITGGVASVIYGDPRFTRDIDLVVALDPGAAERVIESFDAEAFYLPPIEVLRDEAARPGGGHFNILHRDTALRADVYVMDDDPLHRWGMGRRVRLRVGAIDVHLAPIEYVILRKLQYYQDSESDRHLRDIVMMLRVSGDLVDEAALAAWARRLGVAELLEQVG